MLSTSDLAIEILAIDFQMSNARTALRNTVCLAKWSACQKIEQKVRNYNLTHDQCKQNTGELLIFHK